MMQFQDDGLCWRLSVPLSTTHHCQFVLEVRWNRRASLAKDENVLSNDLHLEQAKRTMSTKDNRSN